MHIFCIIIICFNFKNISRGMGGDKPLTSPSGCAIAYETAYCRVTKTDLPLLGTQVLNKRFSLRLIVIIRISQIVFVPSSS